MYDLIHGHADELMQLLGTLGYQKTQNIYGPRKLLSPYPSATTG